VNGEEQKRHERERGHRNCTNFSRQQNRRE
jgi:hypothetical protein